MDHSQLGESRHVVLLGAGASSTGEAGLPLFAALREAIFDGVPLDDMCDLDSLASDDLRSLLELLAPEALLLLLDRVGVPVTETILDCFNQTHARPNAVHLVAAHLASAGVPVWTTNYDTLIEEAAIASGLSVSVSVSTADDSPGDAALVKVHGSFSVRYPTGLGQASEPPGVSNTRWAPAGPLLYTAPPLVAGLPAPVRDRLHRDVDGAHLVVLGYAGADVDLYPALRDAIATAASVTWFEINRETRVNALLDRFAGRGGRAVRTARDANNPDADQTHESKIDSLDVDASEDPSRAFITWAIDARPDLLQPLHAELESRSTQFHSPSLRCPTLDVPPEGLYRLAFQLGIDHTIRPEAAKLVPWLIRRRLRGRALGRRARRQPGAGAALALAGSLPAPAPMRDWLRRMATQERASVEKHPSTRTILRWLRQRWEPHLALAATHALKFDGRLQDATRLAADSLRYAMTEPDRVDVVGALSFQYSDLLSIAGDFDAARNQARLGYSSVTSVVMALWEQLVPEACLVAEGTPLSEQQLAQANKIQRLFGTVQRIDGQLWSSLTLGLHQKNSANWEQARSTFETVRQQALGGHHTPALPGVAARASLQLADTARLHGDTATARHHLDDIPKAAGLVHVWARLIRGLVDARPVSDLDAELRPAFDTEGCPLGGQVLDRLYAAPASEVPVNWT